VQQEEVFAAADALLAEQLRPTIERVRLKIGRGSPNTVAPMLESWFAALGQRLGVAGPSSGQGAPPAVVRQAIESLWSAALTAAHEQAAAALGQERSALAAELAGIQTAREELARHEAALGDRQAALEQSLGLAKAQLQDQAGRLTQLQIELQRRDQQVATGRDSLANLIQERDAERRVHDAQMRAVADDRQRADERAITTERRLLEEVDRARQEAKQARSALADAERRNGDQRKLLEQTNEALGRRCHEAELTVASLRERLTSADQRAAEFQHLLDGQRSVTDAITQLKQKAIAPTPHRKKNTKAKQPVARAARAVTGS
jgi:chromosome segregation ATPase